MLLRFAFFSVALIAAGTAAAAQATPDTPACGPDKLGTYRELQVGTEGGTRVGLKTYPNSLRLEDHEVVLTFDDGPNSPTTGLILDALRDECVRATFFLVGRRSAESPKLVQRELREHHTVGHHSMTHPDLTLRGIAEKDERAALAEIDKGITADEQAAGNPSPTSVPVRTAPFFRYPGFADTERLNEVLAERHIAIFGADLWASDWNRMTPEKELQLLESRLEAKHKGIILLHDTKPQTAEMLPRFLRFLKEKGYRVVAIVPGPGMAELAPTPEGWSSETEASLAKIMPKLERAAAHAHPRAMAPAMDIGGKPVPHPIHRLPAKPHQVAPLGPVSADPADAMPLSAD